ncbi:MAG: outer membrane protein transport protein [Sandaracinus sp.]
MRHARQTVLVVLAAAFVVALGASRAAAQPMDTYGMGSRSIAMAGAVTADTEDFSANYYNPAGLARGTALRISMGWYGAIHDLHVDGASSNVDPLHGAVMGLVVPGRLGDFRFAFGLAVHLPDDAVSRTRSLPRAQPRWELYDNRGHRIYLAAHLAIRPWDWLMIGGGISFLSLSSNALTIRGDLDIVRPESSHLESSLLANLTTIRYPQVGIQIMPIPELSFGAVYRGQFALDNTLTARVGCAADMPDCPSATTLGSGSLSFRGFFDLYTQSVNAFVPQQVSLGASWSIIPELRVNLEVTWVNWSSYVSPIGTSRITLQIDVPPALRDSIRIPSSIAGSTPIAANFADRFVPRLGVEGLAFEDSHVALRLRGGFFYEQTPVPDQTGLSSLIDTDRFVWAAGLGLALTDLRPLIDGSLSFDLHLSYAYLPDRTTRKTSLVDTTGDFVAGGQMFIGGLTMELAFR